MVVSVSLEFRAPADTPRVEEIKGVVETISGALDHIAEGLGVKVGKTQVFLTEDFAGEVEATTREIDARTGGPSSPPFTVERLGGVVAGKTLARDDDYRDATVLVAEGIAWDDQVAFSAGIALISHELSHVCIGRARWASSALEGVVFPSITGTEYARSIARISAEEYRATVLANALMGVLLSVGMDGNPPRPMTVHDVMGDGYTDRLAQVLDEVIYPGWPDTVTKFRCWGMPLDALGKHMIEGTDQVFTILGHAESHAEAGGRPRPLDVCAAHRGVELYLGPAWERLIAPARASAPVPSTLEDVRKLEDEIVTEGAAAILAMWLTLGIRIEERGNREWAMWVNDPQR